MANNPRRKSDAARRANQVIRSRTVLIMSLLGVVTFLALFWKLYDLQIRQHAELQEKAVAQQTASTVVTASRGTIYDSGGNVLAESATAELIFLSPLEIQAFVDDQEDAIEEAAKEAEEKGESYTPPEVLDQSYIARGLSRILGLDEETILTKMEKTETQYQELVKKAEQDVADEVRRFINGEIDDEGNAVPEDQQRSLRGIFLRPNTKRYYRYGSLASNVLGFVNADNIGAYGLEAQYDSVLTGTAGLTVTAKNNYNQPLLFNYEQYYDAENGGNLVLTLDVNVQYYLEKGIESMVKKFDAKNGATGIVMDVNTGAIVAMASYPNYDPNDYSTVTDEKLLATLEGLTEGSKEYNEALGAAQLKQWRNKCYQDTYEPGSTFSCSGSTMVQGWSKPFYCSNHSGHGVQDLKTATGNSCNPAFITMGLKIGTQTYYQYLKSFGFMESTGVDLPAEVSGGIFASEKDFNSNVVSLASYAFGQTFNITPLQLIRAQAATINGGYLYTPYLVEEVLDDDGNIISQHESTPVRQVVSEETSAKVRECLEYVVSSGTGRNGQVAGYRIGGKTGTADKTGSKTASNPKGDIVVSFMCFAPADDPQYIMLITMDTPSRTTGTYPSGGNMVAPTASQIMSEILPILGVEPDYTSQDLAAAETTVPNVVGKSLADAKEKLESIGFSVRTVGNGATVTDQTPVGGAIVPSNATIVLYLGAEKPDTPCTVPNVVGKSAAAANEAITNAGLIMKVTGATSSSSGNVYAISQDTSPGTQVKAGTVITVQMGSQSSSAD